MINKTIQHLVTSAVRAPSGDNTQPWRFEVDSESRLVAFFVDETRDVSPMNAGQRMSRIAVGAALENFLHSAERMGLSVDFALPPPKGASVALQWQEPLPDTPLEMDDVIRRRVTNRRPFDGRPLSKEILTQLKQATPLLDGVKTHWIVDRIPEWAAAIGRADALMFGESPMRAAFLEKVRFDAPNNAEVDEGLPLDSLETSAAQRLALRIVRKMPDWAFKLVGVTPVFASLARKLVTSSGGLCLVAASDNRSETDVTVGRAMERAWLALASHDIATQPMMSLCVLDNTLQHGSAELIEALGRAKLEEIGQKPRDLLAELGDARAACLLRFGYAAQPSGRTGRLPLDGVMTEIGSGER